MVPVRLDGVHQILPSVVEDGPPGPVSVAFGAPLRLKGDDYAALARQVEERFAVCMPRPARDRIEGSRLEALGFRAR